MPTSQKFRFEHLDYCSSRYYSNTTCSCNRLSVEKLRTYHKGVLREAIA